MTEPTNPTTTPTPPSYNMPPPAVQQSQWTPPQTSQPPAAQWAPPTQQAPKRKRRIFRKLFIGVVALIGLIILLAVVAKPEVAVNAVVPGAVPSTTTGDVYVPPGSPEAVTGGPLAFAAPYKWEDGLKVTVGKPQSFKPSKSAIATAGAARYVTMEITIVNGTPGNYSAGTTAVSATAGGTAADMVFDSASKINWAPQTEILPGKSATFRVAWAIPSKDAVELQVQVAPGYGVGYSNAIYLGTF